MERLKKQRLKIEELKGEYDGMLETLKRKDEVIEKYEIELRQARQNEEYRLRYEKLVAAVPSLEGEYRQLLDRSLAMKKHIDELEAERRAFPREAAIHLEKSCQQLAQEVQSLQLLILELEESQEDVCRARRKAEKALA